MKRLLGMLASLLNLRSLCFVVTFILLLSPLSLVWLAQPNQFLFAMGAHLTPAPEPASQLVKIVIPQSEMDRLVNDMPGALGMGSVLQGLRGVFTKGVLLLVDELPHTENYATDVLVSRLMNDPALRENLQASGVLPDIEALAQRRDNFNAQVLDGSLLLGVTQTSTARDKVNYLREASLVPFALPASSDKNQLLLARLNSFFQPSPLQLANFRYESKTPAYPVYSSGNTASYNYPLLWRVGNDYFPDAIVALLKKSRGVNQVTGKSGNLGMDDKSLPFSEGDVIYPMFSSVTGLPDHIETIDLAELKNPADYNRFYNKTVIIGVKGSRTLADAAATYYSLDKHAYYTVPNWYLLAEKGGLLLLLLYLFLLLPLVRVNVGLMITAFLAAALLVLQMGLQISQMQWLPIGLLLVFLLAGHLCVLLWMLQKKIVSSPISSARSAQKSNTLFNKQKSRQEPGFFSMKKSIAKQDSIFERTSALKPQGLRQLGRYIIDSELGRGAMGVVYLGHDTSIDRKVAIKTLNYDQFPKDTLDEVKERFFREAKAAGNLKHQNIVTIYEMAEDEERAFIAMEYVGGKPLSAYIKKGQLLPVDEVYWIVLQVAEALGYAHEHNIVHRDIKPSNILYDRDREEVKVADFGIARITDHASTRTGDILGSPLYMSPEQIKGERVMGQSDIFSLGVTFYQLLTGELPFSGDTMVAITHQIVNGKYTSVTEINPRLPESAQRIIAKALQKNPEKRFETAYEMSDMLQKYRDKS